MKYISTRSKEKEYSFGEVFLKGLADDGGLYVPKSINKYKIEYPKTFFALFKSNLSFLNLYRS